MNKKLTTLLLVLFALVGGSALYAALKNNQAADPDKKMVRATAWYALYDTPSSSYSNQYIVGGGPMTTPPDEENDTTCAQYENNGNFCAVLLDFPVGTPALPDSTTVQQAISNYGATIVTDIANDGYAQLP